MNQRKRKPRTTPATSRLRVQKSRSNQEDEKEVNKKKDRERKKEARKKKRLRMQKSRSNQTEKEINDQRKKNTTKRKEKRGSQTEDEKEVARKKDRERKKETRKKKQCSQTEEEKEALKKKDRERKAKQKEANEKALMGNGIEVDNGEDEEWLSDEDDEEELLSDETISKATAAALKYLHQTHIKGTNLHQANVCVVCDCFIIGTEPVRRLNKNRLTPHNERLGVKNYKKYYKLKDMPEDLRNYYKVKEYPDMLLSPRANMNKNGYSCCATCDNSMNKRDKKKKPPKLSIANGFVIGDFPKIQYTDDNGQLCEFSVESDLSEVMRALLAPTRTHGYVMAFTGGKHRSIMGHYQFFEMDQTRLGGAINHIRHNEKRQHVFCMLSGRMTPQQKTIAKKKCIVDTNLYTALSTWFIKESGHRGFAKVPIPEECPQPVIIMDEDTTNNLDQSASKDVEESFGGGSYYFSSIQDPNPDNSVYENGEKFTVAMLNQANPTLLVYGGKYANMAEIELENLLPFAFPYGVGTPKQKRPNRVSFQACIQRYMRLAMLQFMRGDVILVMNHIYGRQVSYQSGVMTSRSNVRGETLGEQFSKISVEELQAAADENDPQTSTMVKTLMKSIFTSCKALGHTPEAAQFARRCCFSMQDFFGLNSVFITITPDDECNFRIKLLTRLGEEVSQFYFGKKIAFCKKSPYSSISTN